MSAVATYRVALLAANGARVEFEAPPTQSLIKAAARAGYLITTGCLQGRCAICRAVLISGSVAALRRASPNALGDAAQRSDGTVLLCSVAAGSDVELAPLSAWRMPVAR